MNLNILSYCIENKDGTKCYAVCLSNEDVVRIALPDNQGNLIRYKGKAFELLQWAYANSLIYHTKIITTKLPEGY